MMTHLKRGISALLLLAVVLPLLSGCWDRREINDIAIALATAIDREENGMYRISVQLALPGQMGGISGGGGGTGGEKSFYIDSEVGRTAREAVDKLQARMSRTLFFSHCRVMIISEELARQGISELFDVSSRVPQNRLTAYMVISKGPAYRLLQARPKFERFSGEAIREIVKQRGVMNINMKQLAQAMNTTGKDGITAYVGIKKSEKNLEPTEEVEVLGYAQLRNDVMVDILKNDVSYAIKWLKRTSEPHTITLPWKDRRYVTINVQNVKMDIRPEWNGETLTFHIRGMARGYLQEDLSDSDLRLEENISILNRKISEEIEKSVRSAISKIQKNRADSAGFGSLVSRYYPRAWEERFRKNWPDALREATFDISVQTKLSRMGRTTNNITVKGEGT